MCEAVSFKESAFITRKVEQLIMRTNVKRAAAGLAASAIGVLAAFVVTASPAEAICRGVGDGATLTRTYNGHVVAEERQVTGTCDSDNIYNGQLRDPYTDGYAAQARYVDGSFDEVMAIARTTSWVTYQFRDRNGNSYTLLEIYSSPASRPATLSGSWGY